MAKTIVIKENDINTRLDNFLSKYFLSLSKTNIYKLIRTKKIKVNNKKVDFNYRLQIDDIIICYFNYEEITNHNNLLFLQSSHNLEIAYEDENILIVNKPFNMIVYDEKEKEINTLINHAWKYLYDKKEYHPDLENNFKPYLAHRIDQNTSGLVVIAKNKQTLTVLNDAFKYNMIKRYYCCLVHGLINPTKKTINNFIKKEDRYVKASFHKLDKDYKEAITRYSLIDYISNKYSLLDVELLTGRTHQIRATMNSISFPIVGEKKYTNKTVDKDNRFKHQCLVSYKLKFLDLSGTHLEYLTNKEIKLSSIWFLDFLNYKKW